MENSENRPSDGLFGQALSSLAAGLLIGSAQSAVLYDLSTASIGSNTFTASPVAGGQGASLSGNLVFATTGTIQSSYSDYFIGKFSSQSLLNEGDMMTLSFSATSGGIVANDSTAQTLRFGLFNVGSATTGSGTPAANSFSSATGYRADYSQINSSSNGIRERTGSGVNLFSTGISPLVGTQSSSNFQLDPVNGVYSGSLTLELLSAGQVQITSTIGSLSQTVVDTSGVFSSFDAFSFFLVDSANSPASLSFSALAVTYTPVPEPSAFVLSLGGFLVLARRRSIFFGSRFLRCGNVSSK